MMGTPPPKPPASLSTTVPSGVSLSISDSATSHVSGSTVSFSRTPPKGDARNVLDYEIQMLRFTYGRLTQAPSPFETPDDLNAYLESYLVHYRALLEFFLAGGRAPDENGRQRKAVKPKADDIVLTKPDQWARGRSIDGIAITEINTAALAIAVDFEALSKQLVHCTMLRVIDKKTWLLPAMHEKLDAIVQRFEKL
jgi:hypothetical protein